MVAFVLATAWLVVVIAPIYYMVLASFRSQGNYLTENPWLPSGGLTVSEYGTVFGTGLGRYLLNSAILTAVCVLLTLSISLGAAFRIVRRSTRAAGVSFRVWNNFILPLVLTQSNSVAVLPLGLTKLEGQYAINVPAIMAAVLLSVLPLVVLFIVMRKQVMRSLGSVVMR